MSALLTTSGNLSPQYQKYFNKKLLAAVIPEIHLNESAEMYDLPADAGAKSVSMFRYDSASANNVVDLSEGVPISVFSDMTLTEINVPLVQRGEVIKMSDILGATNLFNALERATERLGQDCALKADNVSRDELVINGTNEIFAGTATSFTTLSGLTNTAGQAIIDDILRTRTILKRNNTPTFAGGTYSGHFAAEVIHSFLLDQDLREILRYPGQNDKIFKGEVGQFFGVRVIENTNSYQEVTTENVYVTTPVTNMIYSNLVCGKGAFGVAKLAAQSPFSPRIIVTAGADKSDYLDQVKTAGFKSYSAAKILNANFFVNLRAKSPINGA